MPDHGAVLPLISGFCHQDDRQGAGGRPTHSERLEGQCVQAAVRCSERPHYLAGGYPSAIDADPKRRGDVFLLYPAAVDRGAGDGRRKKDEMWIGRPLGGKSKRIGRLPTAHYNFWNGLIPRISQFDFLDFHRRRLPGNREFLGLCRRRPEAEHE
jgi:hypothetical protein